MSIFPLRGSQVLPPIVPHEWCPSVNGGSKRGSKGSSKGFWAFTRVQLGFILLVLLFYYIFHLAVLIS